MKDDDTISDRKTLRENELEGHPETTGETLSGTVTEGGDGRVVLGGRYRVVRRLGEGGMGSVWLAEDLKLDGLQVAIKMLPAVLAGKKGAYRQVKQEALMAMKLSHPNIATVRAFEEDEGGAPFLVMDYIEGTGLDEILAAKEKLTESETFKLLGPVAAALDYAHAKGVVHRDVKPGNVIVDKDGTPYVLDFGIAREIQETMTRVTGKFSSGTLLYMSPEQLRGRAPKAAQDVYSFAAMAYECLAGHPPFYRGGVEDQIKNEPPEELEESVASEALRGGVMAGLAKEPEKRPGSCAEVLGERGAIGGASRSGEPEKGTPITRTARPEGSPHQRPTARPLSDADAATAGGRDENGNVFLRKGCVEKALEEARRIMPRTHGAWAWLARWGWGLAFVFLSGGLAGLLWRSTMNWVDWLFAVMVLWGATIGARRGLSRELGMLTRSIVALLAVRIGYAPLADSLARAADWNPLVARLVAVVAIWFVAMVAMWLLGKAISSQMDFHFMEPVECLGGLLTGALRRAVIFSVALLVAYFVVDAAWLQRAIRYDSKVGSALLPVLIDGYNVVAERVEMIQAEVPTGVRLVMPPIEEPTPDDTTFYPLPSAEVPTGVRLVMPPIEEPTPDDTTFYPLPSLEY